MKPLMEPLTTIISVTHNDRLIEAEVQYIRITVLEPRPYGDGLAYERTETFSIQNIEYLTEDMTTNEKLALDDKILEGPYE